MSLCREGVLSCCAERTFKIIRKILELCSGSYSLIRSAELFVIFPSADVANILHFHTPFLWFLKIITFHTGYVKKLLSALYLF